MSSATSLKEWRDQLKRLDRQLVDAHKLSREMHRALQDDIARAQSRIRFFEAEVELETLQQEMAQERMRRG